MYYALVDNLIIKVGPREYHAGFFDDYLKSKNIDFKLPLSQPYNEPIIVNDEISILPVTDIETPSYHPITEQLAGPFYNITPTEITGKYTIADDTIESSKAKMKQIIAALRYNKENTIIKVSVQNTEVSIDTTRGESRNFYLQSYFLMNDNETKKVKFKHEDVWLTLTKSDFLTIVTEINKTVQDSFDWENEQFLIIESADKQTLETQYNNLFHKPTEING